MTKTTSNAGVKVTKSVTGRPKAYGQDDFMRDLAKVARRSTSEPKPSSRSGKGKR